MIVRLPHTSNKEKAIKRAKEILNTVHLKEPIAEHVQNENDKFQICSLYGDFGNQNPSVYQVAEILQIEANNFHQ